MGFNFLYVHGWSMIPLISGILLLPLGLVLVIMAAVRRGQAQRASSTHCNVIIFIKYDKFLENGTI